MESLQSTVYNTRDTPRSSSLTHTFKCPHIIQDLSTRGNKNHVYYIGTVFLYVQFTEFSILFVYITHVMSSTSHIILYIGITLFAIVCIETMRIVILSQRAICSGKKVTPVMQQNEGATKRVLVIGDSTSYGTGALESENSLVGRLAKDFPNIEIVNASENAMSMKRLHEKLQTLKGEKFDIIMIHIGGIDMLSFTPSAKIHTLAKDIFSLTRELSAQKVLLVSMNNPVSAPLFRFPVNHILDKRSKVLTDVFADVCAQSSIDHVPLYVDDPEDPFHSDPERYYAYDGVHPNDEGYGVVYKKIKTRVAPHLQ